MNTHGDRLIAVLVLYSYNIQTNPQTGIVWQHNDHTSRRTDYLKTSRLTISADWFLQINLFPRLTDNMSMCVCVSLNPWYQGVL